MSKQRRVLRYQEKYALAEQLRPRYHTASRTQKTLFLDAFVKATGYTRKSALRLLHHPPGKSGTLTRPRAFLSGPKVQEALMLAWKATDGVCAKRLVPFLPVLLPLLERGGHVHLSEEDRHRLLAMSISTAERMLKTQPKPGKRNLSATTPGPLAKSQIPLCLFAPWEENRPGFVEADLVAHGGETLSGRFLFTLTLTDLATGWTECVPLFSKSANAVVAGLSQARMRFPFPLLGIDTDCGAEFLNEKVIAYCREHHLTFTRGRPYVKTDHCHVEQKMGPL